MSRVGRETTQAQACSTEELREQLHKQKQLSPGNGGGINNHQVETQLQITVPPRLAFYSIKQSS